MKKIISIATATLLSTSLLANADMQTQIDELTKEVQKLKKDSSRTKKSLSAVKKATGGDNIKFGVDFRNTFETLDYDGTVHKNGVLKKVSGSNDSLLTSRLYLNMAATPMDGLIFKGQLAVYSLWGAHLIDESNGHKSWSGSSKATDTIMRIREAYFVYSNDIGEQPISFSIGRRPATNGFLANYRENEENPGSPLAHITNMEVDAAMVKLSWDRFIEGAYTKFVYGRSHAGEIQGVYGINTDPARTPFVTDDSIETWDDQPVDFFVMPGAAYDNAQYKIMYEWAHIFNTKGKNVNTGIPKGAAGTADLFSVGLLVDGIGDEISDFLDESKFFISGAYTNYSAKSGHSLIGSEDGGSESGSSIWAGVIIPDMITDSGKLGFEYNHGSQYWTPMTWAEDTAMGSKVAVRGDAYEAYWNFDLFGVKYLPSQVRYTYVQHDYTPNINCAGWVAPEKADITAQNLRFAVSYRY